MASALSRLTAARIPRASGWRFCLPKERSKKVTGRGRSHGLGCFILRLGVALPFSRLRIRSPRFAFCAARPADGSHSRLTRTNPLPNTECPSYESQMLLLNSGPERQRLYLSFRPARETAVCTNLPSRKGPLDR